MAGSTCAAAARAAIDSQPAPSTDCGRCGFHQPAALPMSFKRIFISAVSAEFGELRLKLSEALQRAGINADHQDIFAHTPRDTVRMLSDRIRRSPLVVHIVGHEPGHVAGAAAVADLLGSMRAEEFLGAYPDLRRSLGDFSGITYTQWEALLALHHGVELMLYVPASARVEESSRIKSEFSQKQHLDRLAQLANPVRPWFCRDDGFIATIPADVYNYFGIPAEPQRAPPYHLPERNGLFRGRKSDLDNLAAAFNHAPVIGITQQAALFASGGVGKSSLALEFAWSCVSRHDSFAGGVFWCDCRGRGAASLAQGLAAFAAPLSIADYPGEDVFAVARRVRDRLTSGPPSLLVLDNVLDAGQWKEREWNELLPRGNCRRLLTTRAELLGDHRIKMISLNRLSTQDARALLHAYRDDVAVADTEDSVQAVIDWFGGLAIGLTVVGIYMANHADRSFDDYWRSLRERKLDAVRSTESMAAPADYENRVDAVIEDLYLSRTRTEQRALQFACLLPQAEISDRWLIDLAKEDFARHKIEDNTTRPGFDSHAHYVVARLAASRILQRVVDTPARKALTLHQVIREKLREILGRNPARWDEVSERTRHFVQLRQRRSRELTRAIISAPGFADALALFESVARENSDPDKVNYNALLAKADSFEQARQVVADMYAVNLKPDIYTFNTLLVKASFFAAAQEVLAEMLAANIKPDEYSFTTLMSKADSFAAAKAVFAQVQAAGPQPTIEMLNTLLSKASNDAERSEVGEQIVLLGLKPSAFTYTKQIEKAESYEQARALFDAMRLQDCMPDVFTYNMLLRKADSYEEACKVLAGLRAAGYKPNKYTIDLLCGQVRSFAEAADAIVQWRTAGGTPGVKSYNLLLACSTTAEEFKTAVTALRASGLPPTGATFRTLQQIRSLAGTEECLAWLQQDDSRPELQAFAVLLSSHTRYAQAREAIARLRETGMAPDASLIQAQLQKAQTAEERHETLEDLRAIGSRPDWNLVLAAAETFAEARQIAAALQIPGTQDSGPYRILIERTSNYAEARAVIDDALGQGLTLAPDMISRLFSRSDGLPPAEEVLDWYLNLPGSAHINSLNGLIASLSKLERLEEAAAVAARFPELDAAQKLMRKLAARQQQASADADAHADAQGDDPAAN
jgi:Pentatricopeptide repeat domain